VNPETAERCDCGYDFATHTVKESYLVRDLREQNPDLAEWLRTVARGEIRTGALVLAASLGVAVLSYFVIRHSRGSLMVMYGAIAYGAVALSRGLHHLSLANRGIKWKN
jgi:hypothetical protein